METFVGVFLPAILYIVAIILLIVLIIVGIKLIKVLDKVDRIADNVEEKVNAFNEIFAVMKRASDSISSITDSFVFSVTSLISKLLGKFKGNYKEEEDYE